MRYIFLLSLPLFALDQVTKWLVLVNIHPEEAQIPVVSNFFYLVNVTNNGAAFGSFKNNNTFFIVLASLAFVFVLVLLIRSRSKDTLRDISLGLLLAGVMGNLTDRIVHGHVIDFLLFDLHVPLAHPWPAFNVADSCICIAVVCFVIDSFKKPTAVEEQVEPQ